MSEEQSVKAAGVDTGQTDEEERVLGVNPMKERSRVFIGCLYELHRRNPRYCFTAAFVDKMFRPYLLNKLSRWNGDIQAAVDLWCDDPAVAEEQYGHISKWDVSHVTNMEGLFREKGKFNEDISAWDVSNVTAIESMFHGASAFNQPLAAWDVSQVKNMHRIFKSAIRFNQPIGNWDTSNVKNMSTMFSGARAFNQPIDNWDVSKVEDMGYMFTEAEAFNQPIGN